MTCVAVFFKCAERIELINLFVAAFLVGGVACVVFRVEVERKEFLSVEELCCLFLVTSTVVGYETMLCCCRYC